MASEVGMKPSYTSGEKNTVEKLAALFEELDVEDPFTNRDHCSAFLKEIEFCAERFGLEAVPRTYRKNFSPNYCSLFKNDFRREYQADVLQASFDQCPAMYVNGKACLFTRETIQKADKLSHCFDEFGSILTRWSAAIDEPCRANLPARREIIAALAALDAAWADFERIYVDELIAIEETARKPLADAVYYETRIARLEFRSSGDKVRYAEEMYQLFACLAELNAVANNAGVGRDDLNAEVLLAAQEVLEHADNISGDAGVGSILHTLALDLVDSFESMREYLRSVGHCMTRVDPHLNKNEGLVSHLEDLENAWEMCHRYVQDKAMRDALAHVAQGITQAQAMVPDLKRMCLHCDVELFMVLPRLIWLGFLRKPVYNKLLNSLLPDCFTWENAEGNASAKLQSLVDKFNFIQHLLVDAQSPMSHGAINTAQTVTCEILTHRVVLGAGLDDENMYERLSPSQQEKSRGAVEEFMRDLESWSIELQRHCPRDWNDCSAMLVRWASGEARKERKSSFRV